MGQVHVITDTACDIPRPLLEQHGVEMVPLTIRFGDDEFTDGVDLSTAEFWKRCRESDTLPETAAPSPGAFQAAYERAAAAGATGVVVVALSSALSGTFQSAQVAADAVAATIPVRVVDSRMVTAAQGLLVLEAVAAAEAGGSIDEVADAVTSRIGDCDLVGTLNTLDHLVKSGRVSGAKALVGSLLSVKPLLTIRDGAVVEAGRQRTRARALDHCVKLVADAGPLEWLACAGGDAADLGTVADKLRDLAVTHPLIVTEIGPVVGTHGGPGIIGIAWMRRR
jgi:DegV family protein with EDD domain